MYYSTADQIVKSILMNKKYSIHWYVEVMKYLSDCLRELAMDDLKIVNSTWLTLTPYRAAAIPPDFLDFIRIGVPNGEFVRPMTQNEGYNRLLNYDPNGNPQPWPQIPDGGQNLTVFGVPYLSYYVNMYNARGENVGGLYGYRTDGSPFTFEIVPERNEIQFDSQFSGCERIVMDYLSDGRTVSAASKVITYAEKTIEDYVDLQLDENNRSTPESVKMRKERKYVGSRTLLRGRLNDLTVDDYLSIYRNTYNAAPKT